MPEVVHRTAWRLWAAGALLLLLLTWSIDSFFAYSKGWRPEDLLERLLFWLPTGCLLALLLALVIPPVRQRLSLFASRLLLLLGTSALLLTLAELGLVAFAKTPESFRRFHRKAPFSHYVFRPASEVMPGVSGDAHYRTNELGLRGLAYPPAEDAYHILCIGGSTTICQYLDDAETWPQQLMTLLRAEGKEAWVGNAGKNGYSTPHHLRLLQDGDLLPRVDCCIFLIGINDLLLALENQRVRFRGGRPPLWRRSAWAESLSLLQRRFLTSRSLQVEDESGEVYTLRRKRRQQAERTSDLPDLEPGLREYGKRIEAMIEVSRKHGVRPVFASQPVLWQVGLEPRLERLLWMGSVTGGKFLAAEVLRAAMDQFNGRLAQVSRENQVEFVDLSPLSGRPELFYDDCHFNEKGAQEVARLLLRHFLRTQGLDE
jgi:lysophospholipase L1-like esterase